MKSYNVKMFDCFFKCDDEIDKKIDSSAYMTVFDYLSFISDDWFVQNIQAPIFEELKEKVWESY